MQQHGPGPAAASMVAAATSSGHEFPSCVRVSTSAAAGTVKAFSRASFTVAVSFVRNRRVDLFGGDYSLDFDVVSMT